MIRLYAGLIVSILVSAPALGQVERLESVLARGAKRLSGAEAKAALTGNVLVGPYHTGEILTVYYNPDGSLAGTNHSTGAQFQGDWSVDDRGLQCLSYWIPGWGGENICRLWFRLGDVLYVLESESDEDRSQFVYARTLNRR